MESDFYKIVNFGDYCGSCQYEEFKEEDEPCYECLANPDNLYSHKPIKYVKKED